MRTSPATRSKPARDVLVLQGYGLRIAVERGHLVVEDGLAAKRDGLRFAGSIVSSSGS